MGRVGGFLPKLYAHGLKNSCISQISVARFHLFILAGVRTRSLTELFPGFLIISVCSVVSIAVFSLEGEAAVATNRDLIGFAG